MRLYHGTNCEIDHIDLNKSKVGKDFGCGFYLSAERGQAEEIANRKLEQQGVGVAKVYEYEFDEALLQDGTLSVCRFEDYSKEWAEFVLQNRQNRTRCQLHTFDIVIGPIANDTVGFQIRKFTSGIINLEQFVEELRYMKGITYQYFFATEKALKHLKPL